MVTWQSRSEQDSRDTATLAPGKIENFQPHDNGNYCNNDLEKTLLNKYKISLWESRGSGGGWEGFTCSHMLNFCKKVSI